MTGAINNSMATKSDQTTAGIIIIGDEILKGQTQDTNTYFLAQGLRKLGVSLKRVSVITDDVSTIAEEVKLFSGKYDLVLTSGGIGPTHDDLTFEGVARAFSDSLEHNAIMVKLCKAWFKKDDLQDPCFKLAHIPSKSQLNFGTDKTTGKPTIYPLVSVENVFIFPGIPELLRKAFNNLGEDLFKTDQRFVSGEVFLSQDEVSITTTLNRLVAGHSGVIFGSYPAFSNQFYRSKITLEAKTKEEIDLAKLEMEELKPVRFDPNPTENAWDKIQKYLSESDDQHISEVVENSLNVVEKCFNKYGPEGVSVCFNGGKDCIVMLHLVHAFFQKHYADKQLKSFYISEEKTFPEVDSYMNNCISTYRLSNSVYPGPMKDALAKMMEEDTAIQATILGVRNGDPGSRNLSDFSPTDGDWPRVMRVNPILQWSYSGIWRFLRGLSIPYPVLYDQGYTSLGNPDNTVKNPSLAYMDPLGVERFKPAYCLEDPTQERRGRI